MEFLIAVVLIFGVVVLGFVAMIAAMAMRMKAEHYQIPYVEKHLLQERDTNCSSDDLSWKRYREALPQQR